MPPPLRVSGSKDSADSPASKRTKCEHSYSNDSRTPAPISTSTMKMTTCDRDSKIEKVYEEVSLSKWWKGFHENDDGARLPLVDLRCDIEYNRRHLNLMMLPPSNTSSSSASSPSFSSNHTRVVHLPFHSLQSGERSCELPPRHVKFAILLPQPQPAVDASSDTNPIPTSATATATTSSTTTGPCTKSSHTRQEIEGLFFATKSKATAQSRKPWLVKQVIVDSDHLWEEAQELGILAAASTSVTTSCSSNTNKDMDEPTSESSINPTNNNDITGYNENNSRLARKLSRLWEPDRMVENVLLPLLQDKLQKLISSLGGAIRGNNSNSDSISVNDGNPQFTVWDLGSGAGRDVSFLAEELKSCLMAEKKKSPSSTTRLRVTGIDNHKGSARRCIPLWKNRFVDDVTESRLQDLKNTSLLNDRVEEEKSGLVCLYAIRFLNRKLVEYIAKDTHFLKGGCLFAMSHFCKEKDGEWKWDHPKPSSVLDRDELRDLFSSTGNWKVLHDELCKDGDHGRYLVHFVAEKCD